ncbi:retrovirus-related pol polyprotein from transposon TNT 1-94 [Tanacetum coccineum]
MIANVYAGAAPASQMQLEKLKLLQRQFFRSLEDWKKLKRLVSLLEGLQGGKELLYIKEIKQSPWEMLLLDPTDEVDTRRNYEYLNDLEEEYQARALLAKSKRFFKKSPDDEEDTRSSHEYLNDLEEEYQAKDLLAKSKRFFKKVPSYQSPFQSKSLSSSQHKPELRPTKDFEAKYNKVKAKLTLLSLSASDSKASTVKNKGLIAKAYEWLEEEVSSYDNEMVEVKVLMALAEDNDVVSKKGTKNGEWFNEKRGTIFNSNKEVVMIASRVGDVYVFDMTSSAQESCFFAKASENLNWLWHKRLAYLNFKTINKLAKQNLVIGLPSLVYSKDKPCLSCEKGKHHRTIFKTKQISSIKKCLHLLHMDLFGHVTPMSINHEKYTLVIVNEYSMYTWVYFFKKKSQAPETIMSFIKRVENQNDIKVKQLRTDNGIEFRNSILVNFCDEKGIS